jgi:membrane associated rhomboid family serine protease
MSPTLVILILNVVASIYAWNNRSVYYKWMMNPYQVNTSRQYYRFITSGFIHGDWVHLLFNMISLFFFGLNFEYHLIKFTGSHYMFYYYGFYLAALVLSELPTYFKHKSNSNYNSLGASGAVAAVIFACILLDPLERLLVFVFPVPGFIFGFLYLAYSYTFSRRSPHGINHDAHFYGALFGIVFMIVLYPPSVGEFFRQIAQWNLFN